MANHQIIRAPEGTKYLKEVLTGETLPKNCIFDKVLTGCGGSYVALTSPEPYIIAVPTKSLVRDKVTSDQYKPYKIQGVSEDYPLGKRRLYLFDKIIVTYKSLPKVAEKVDISKYNLLIDEMHMLATMTGYARQELSWILNNFKSFKSYCFMSATVPRSEHLLEELKDLPVVGIEWSDIARVDFECLLSSNVTSSLLRVLLEHQRGERVGTPYVFYNSVSGICDIVSRWKNSKTPARFNIICADTKANIKRLKEVREDLGKPNRKADFHFITATAFEGVDFYDPDGVTYIISNNLYYSTKHSIEKLTPEVCQKYSKNKSYLKKLYKARVAEDAVCAEDQISRIFQPGNVYTAAYIKEYLQSLNIPNAKATTLSKWYVIKRVTKNGVACYRIVSRLVDNL